MIPRDLRQSDFSGKYHRVLIKNKYPIPGAALKRDEELVQMKYNQHEALAAGWWMVMLKMIAPL